MYTLSGKINENSMYRLSGKNYNTFEEAMQALMELVPYANSDRLVELSDLLIWDVGDEKSLTKR